MINHRKMSMKTCPHCGGNRPPAGEASGTLENDAVYTLLFLSILPISVCYAVQSGTHRQVRDAFSKGVDPKRRSKLRPSTCGFHGRTHQPTDC
ncbi:MAG: hypothetical protein PWQ89_1841 [Verrucomicrobiota bacterium]|jgi:hypothetical protein|nr:hypothetical protein [Verrucomicrobiota bacterium]